MPGLKSALSASVLVLTSLLLPLAAFAEEGETVELSVGGIDLTVLNLHHGRDRRPPVQNLGLLFTLRGTTFLHVGAEDAPPSWFGSTGNLGGLVEQLEKLPGVEVPGRPGEVISLRN